VTATRPKSAFAAARETAYDTLLATARQLEATLARAQIPGTPEHAELSVRKGMRLAETIARRALALRSVRDPEPWITAPTKERAAKGDVVREFVTAGDDVVGVRHRVRWPVDQLQQRALLEVPQAMAGARFRRAWEDSRNAPGIGGYSGVFTVADPRGRLPTTKGEVARQRGREDDEKGGHAPMAGHEAAFVWERLTPLMRSTAWVLILEEPLPNEGHALTPVEYGRRQTNMRSEEFNRAYALALLKGTLDWMDHVYRRWDHNRRAAGG
jgi:hypothetical protein